MKVSVIIPTWNRVSDLRKTLPRIFDCDPPPDEVLIHIDLGDISTAEFLSGCGYPVRVFKASRRMGPGGGRDRLIREASHEIVASFDDDSYPIDIDYFNRLKEWFERFPSAAMISSSIFHRGEKVEDREERVERVIHFVGCGCAYRRSRYLDCRGYLPIAVPYNIEEIDLSFQLLNFDRWIVRVHDLRVYHDTDMQHHGERRVVAGTIANAGLIAYLHYPASFFPRALVQVANSVRFAIFQKRFQGILAGICGILPLIWRFRDYRNPVPEKVMREYLKLRSDRISLEFTDL